MSSLIDQLAKEEWLTREQISKRQQARIHAVAAYHRQHSPWYKRISGTGMPPIITRKEIQAAGAALFSKPPVDQLPTIDVSTSGSTGEPVQIKGSQLTRAFWTAYVLREHRWNNRSGGLKLSVIRASVFEYVEADNWGPPVAMFEKTGPAQAIPITTDTEQINKWLTEFQPDCLLVYPNTLKDLCRLWEQDYPLKLSHIRTMGEMVRPELREQVLKITGVKISDVYSSQEVGVIAIDCPESDLYHVMAENLIVEVLDDNNKPCNQGEVGRIVVTDLHNYVTPLIRYDIGDRAEVGPACKCGRGLHTFTRILGRERNMLVHKDGRRNWPLIGFYKFIDVANIRRYQFIQHTVDDIELKIATAEPINDQQRGEIRAIVDEYLKGEFNLTLTEVIGDLPIGANGKFEEFISKVS